MELSEIKKQLAELPSKIARADEQLKDLRKKVEEVKLAYDVAYAKRFIELSASEGTVKLKEAQAVIKTQEEAGKLIIANGDYRTQEVKVKELSNMFDGVRKLASIITAEIGRIQ